MVTVLSYNRVSAEQTIIQTGCNEEIARRTNDTLLFIRTTAEKELQNLSESVIHIIYYEVSSKMDVEILKILRQKESDALLMLLTSPKVSPMLYLKPGISPDMLLLRPFTQQEFDTVNRELFDAFFEAQQAPNTDEVFVVTVRNGKTVIPYSKILYFEAANKKISLRVNNEEYDFYDSIENIMRLTPDYFVRTHRAYLVNSRKIRSINKKDGLLTMEYNATVPLSRTYRRNVKL